MADVQGNRQHDAVDRGSPVKIGGKAKSSAPTAVADGDRVDAYFDTTGRQVVKAETAAGGDIGGTQYAEDSAHVSGDSVTLAGVVQQTADAALSSDGDRSLMQVDGTGYLKVNVKAGSAGGTQYTEDAVSAADPTGTAPILVRKDTPAAITTTDGDNVAQRGTNYGAGYVQVVTSGGAFVDTFGGGTQYTEDVASAADPVGNQVIARRRDTLAAETTTDGDNTAVNSTSKGELYVKHVDAVPVTDNSGSLTVDNAGTFSVQASSVIPGTGATNLGKIEDAAHTTGDVGVMALGVRNTDRDPLAGTQGDYSPLGVNDKGDAYVSVTNSALTVTGTVNITDANRAITDSLTVAEDTVVLAASGGGTAAVQVTGTWVATLVFEATVDGTNWFSVNAIVPTTGAIVTSATANGQWLVGCAGYEIIRVRASAYTSGTATVNIEVSSGTQAVIASDGGGSLTVDGTVTANLAAGTNNIGDVDILTIAAGDNNIGNVDIVTVPAPLSTTGGGTEAAALRVTLATDSTGLVSVDDNGGALTVDNAGTFATQVDGAALTALQLIDDPVQVLGTDTYTEATSKGVTLGAVRRDADTTLVGTTNEFGPLQMDANGRLKVEAFSGETLPVSLASTTVTSISAGTNYVGKVRLTDGTLDSSLVDETGASAVDALAVGGGTPHDAVDSGNPQKIGWKAANALPTAVANNDRANGISDLFGRQLVSHIDPAMQVTKAVNVTTTQTGTDVWSPASGKKIAVTYLAVSAYATTGARVILWFGDNADTTYTAGTDQVLWAGSFAPSTTQKPGAIIAFPNPVFCTTADRELHLTTDAGISLDITVYGYEW